MKYPLFLILLAAVAAVTPVPSSAAHRYGVHHSTAGRERPAIVRAIFADHHADQADRRKYVVQVDVQLPWALARLEPEPRFRHQLEPENVLLKKLHGRWKVLEVHLIQGYGVPERLKKRWQLPM